jgi:zinc and cadmium transporter
MITSFLIILFVITFIGGLLPIFIKINEHWSNLLLAFSGATLLGITFLHLLPETFETIGFKGGIFVLTGFFLQLFLQKYSHGLEHGHTHHHHGHFKFMPIYVGLSVHAFLEGIPLGFDFKQSGTISGLVLGVAAHKVPEAITLMSVVATLSYKRNKKILLLLVFSVLTPIAGLLAYTLGSGWTGLNYIVAIVFGAFIHIATTIFFESGAKHHQLTPQKMLAVVCGLGLALLTLLHD